MKNELSPLVLDQIKIAAKRISKKLPLTSDLTHMQILDIATYAMTGAQSFTEAKKLSENILIRVIPKPASKDLNAPLKGRQTVTLGQELEKEPTFKKGDWYFYPDGNLAFEGEFSPYVIGIDRLSTSTQLLDFILQIQKKRWPKKIVEDTNISSTYQVDEFISLIDDLCRYYFGDSIQSTFSPGGQNRSVDWLKAMESKAKANKEEAL